MEDLAPVPRSFAVFISNLADGDAERDLAGEFFDLLATLRKEAEVAGGAAKGSLTFKLDCNVDIKDKVAIRYSIVTKEPAPARPEATVWLDRSGHVVFENPKQARLPFREVGGGNEQRETPRVTLEVKEV